MVAPLKRTSFEVACQNLAACIQSWAGNRFLNGDVLSATLQLSHSSMIFNFSLKLFFLLLLCVVSCEGFFRQLVLQDHTRDAVISSGENSSVSNQYNRFRKSSFYTSFTLFCRSRGFCLTDPAACSSDWICSVWYHKE